MSIKYITDLIIKLKLLEGSKFWIEFTTDTNYCCIDTDFPMSCFLWDITMTVNRILDYFFRNLKHWIIIEEGMVQGDLESNQKIWFNNVQR